MHKRYADYEVADFVADESFKRWVKHRDADDEIHQHWENVRRQFPEKADLMRDAADIVRALSRPASVPAKDNRAAIWAAIKQEALSPPVPAAPPRGASRRWPVYLRYAAAVLLCVATLAARWLYNGPEHVVLTTAYGEQQTLTLPDQSTVTLGANSQLTYRTDWKSNTVREVWLQGEGRFDVQHINRDTTHIEEQHRFLVHAGDDVQVEVLGTTFTIKNRRGKTSVALESGAIAVTVAGQRQHLTRAGQSVEAIPQTHVLTLRQETPPLAQPAVQGLLTLHHTPVRDILVVLEENYGLQVHLADATMSERLVDGALPLYDETLALQVLASILHASVERTGTSITFHPLP